MWKIENLAKREEIKQQILILQKERKRLNNAISQAIHNEKKKKI
mgnify:CR=1 FL=1